MHPFCFQEDLDEAEVKDGIAMAEAEEEMQASSSGTTNSTDGVSALVKAAVDGSLTQAFSGREYRGYNDPSKGFNFFLLLVVRPVCKKKNRSDALTYTTHNTVVSFSFIF